MKIVIITQDDPFYLARKIEYLINILPSNVTISGCVVSRGSPFGKKESFIKKAFKTFHIFGVMFFLRYSIRYIFALGSAKNNIVAVLKKYHIPKIEVAKSINSKISLERIKSCSPDLLISIGGNEIFKRPLIDLAEPFPLSPSKEIIITGLLNLSFNLDATIPITPSCQF